MTNLFNPDAELAVINIILCQPDSIYLIPNLRPFMFSTPANTLIYQTILELLEQGYVPDFAVVAAKLESSHKLNEVGGYDYLNYIKSLTYNVDNLKEFERQIISGYKAKSLISLSVETQSTLKDGVTVEDTIVNMRKKLDDLDSASGGDSTVEFSSASQQMWEELTVRLETPGIRGISTGSRDLDNITGGYNPGDLWVCGGRPGMGKSTDMCNSALAVAKAGNPILMFSLEMPKTQLVERIVSIESEVPLADIRLGTLNQLQVNKVSDTLKKIKDLPIYIDSNMRTDEPYFASTVRKFRNKKGIKVVFFDYVQLAVDRDDNQTAGLGVFSRSGKLLANELEISIVMYSQLNRGVELRDDKHPVLSDLRQSGNLEEDPDLVMFFYRDEYYYKEASKHKGELEKIIAKHRNGPIGTLFYDFDATILKIKEKH